MQDVNFEYVRSLVKDCSGIVLQKEKMYLLESRLSPLARSENCDDVDTLIDRLRFDANEGLNVAIVEAMTTNETFFFRDKTPFDIFSNQVLAYMAKHRPAEHTLRVWSAASSSGQEPFSLRMILTEREPHLGLTSEILATDINSKMIAKAEAGVYSQFEVQRGLSVERLVKYFTKDGQNWVVKPDIREQVTFKQFNLLDDYRALGAWDVVFCRNVMIYFDRETKEDILARIAKQMAPDGFLFLGSAESSVGLSDAFVPVKGMRGLYQIKATSGHLLHEERAVSA